VISVPLGNFGVKKNGDFRVNTQNMEALYANPVKKGQITDLLSANPAA